MRTEIGRIEALFRYPVKSMRGEPVETATLGWHGFDGDRRLALRRLDERGGFPWLTAGKLPDLLLYSPLHPEGVDAAAVPTHVRTPDGDVLPVFGTALAADIGRRLGAPVEMLRLDHGVFDEASVSVITTATAGEVCALGGTAADARRFRPNIVVGSSRAVPFDEDRWVGGVLTFGEGDNAPALAVTQRDIRCVMLNFDPDGGRPAPDMLKAVVRSHQNTAGIYATVTRTGRLAVGQPIVLHG